MYQLWVTLIDCCFGLKDVLSVTVNKSVITISLWDIGYSYTIVKRINVMIFIVR